jgi:hypothetical protein
MKDEKLNGQKAAFADLRAQGLKYLLSLCPDSELTQSKY